MDSAAQNTKIRTLGRDLKEHTCKTFGKHFHYKAFHFTSFEYRSLNFTKNIQ